MHFVQLLTGLKLKKKIMYVVYGIGFFHLSTREIVILPLIYAVNSFSWSVIFSFHVDSLIVCIILKETTTNGIFQQG